jgi:amidase
MPTDPHEDGLAFVPASEQAAQLRERQVSSRELTELYLARIERFDAGLGSYVEVLAGRARHAADAADEVTVSGADTGPLHGVPVAIKDLHFLRGSTTTLGTRAMADHVATFDDHSVARLIDAGAVPLGKTNVPEFGTIGHTDTALLGRCATPWDPTRNAGGSSGGAGAALAAGLCALAHGSDGAGSIRIPAAINGVVGLKPSRDRVSLGPLVGDSAFGLSTPGALTRTVRDAALALDVLAGYEPGDPGMAPPPARPFVDEVPQADAAPGDRLRLGICRQVPHTPDGLHATSIAALETTARVLEDLGHEVEELTLPIGDELADNLLTLWAASLAAQPFDPTTYEPVNAWLDELGRTRSAAAYAAAHFQLQLQARRIVQATSHLDAVVLPVLTAPSRANGHYDDRSGEDVFADQTALVGLTPLANLTGQPAISLPLHHDATVGPVGVQFVGRPWDEAGLLRLAAQLEAAAPWHDRLPDLSAVDR